MDAFSKRYAPLKVGSAESTRANPFLAYLLATFVTPVARVAVPGSETYSNG